VSLADAYSTGSSLMPQKKNPDSFELLRGKSGRLVGSLVTLLTVLKGLPSAYDKDLQEDKEPLFDAADTLELALPVAAGAIATATFNHARMRAALDAAMLATDVADYLVDRGVPFREAHKVVGQLVRAAETQATTIDKLSFDTFRQLHPAFGEDALDVFEVDRSPAARTASGATAPSAVADQIILARAALG
jgi:argininosuccinate lyase